MSVVRMTKYFQAWLKAEHFRIGKQNQAVSVPYFTWLKAIREAGQLPEYYARYQASTKTKPAKGNKFTIGPLRYFIKRMTETGLVYYTGSGASKAMHNAKLYPSLSKAKRVVEVLNIGLPGSPWWLEEV